MKWWNIIKSSRDEAYHLFLEAFGTNGELPEIEMRLGSGMEEEPYMYSAGFGIGFNFTTSKLEFKLIKAPLHLHKEFILGMFENEYPDRYEEIKDKLLEASRVSEGEISIPGIFHTTGEKQDWLKGHEFYSAPNQHFDMSRRGIRRNLLWSLLEYYDDIPIDEAREKMSNVSLSQISVSPNLLDTFMSWLFILAGKSDAKKTHEKLKYAEGMMEVARDINSGKLDDTAFMQEITGPVRIIKIIDEED